MEFLAQSRTRGYTQLFYQAKDIGHKIEEEWLVCSVRIFEQPKEKEED